MGAFEDGVARHMAIGRAEVAAGGSPAQLFEKAQADRRNQEIHQAKLDLAITLADLGDGFDPMHVANAVEELINVMFRGALR